MDPRAEEIADAFERHFHHFGYRKTSVDDVARELKISKKTIYAYFDSKEAILHFLVQRSSATLLRQMGSHLEGLPTAAERLAGLVHLIFTQASLFTTKRDPLDFKYEIAEAAFREAYRTELKAVLEAGIRTGEFQPQPLELQVILLDGLIAAGLRLLVFPQEGLSPTELVSTTTQAVLRVVQ
jgi:AcrR family transcriptional regulator